ncbi:MAG: hypothetical protein GEU90_10190 [Gemmatimonas sp.]|nr:hypothetical protein [Gemmatimonas sp.]
MPNDATSSLPRGGTMNDGIRVTGGLTILLTLGGAGCTAVSPQEGEATLEAVDVPWSEIQAVLDSPEGGTDRQVRVVDIGPSNLAVGILHRTATSAEGSPVTGIVHSEVTEVYYITSGSGTLVTGGEIVNRSPPMTGQIVDEVVGPSFTGESQGGQSRVVSEGDVVVIPAGVFHGWPEVPDHVTYLSIRPDPNRVLPAGYANPAIQ